MDVANGKKLPPGTYLFGKKAAINGQSSLIELHKLGAKRPGFTGVKTERNG